MVKELSWYAGCEFGNDIIVIGAGSSLREHCKAINNFISKNRPIRFGVNKMTKFIFPEYHLWTNNQRLHDQMSCINPESQLMLGCDIKEFLTDRIIKMCGDYISVKYSSDHRYTNEIRCGMFYGDYRTAGLLAIAIANVLNQGTGKIFVVGMDGFTLHSEKDLSSKNCNQHCYGEGETDDYSYESNVKKDEEILRGLRNLKKSGVKFSIITPTKYDEFYDGTIL